MSNEYADSFGSYDIYDGVNLSTIAISGHSLRRRWNGTGNGGASYCIANGGNRGNSGLLIGFGGALYKTLTHQSKWTLGVRIKMDATPFVGGGILFIFGNCGTSLCSLTVNNDGSIVITGYGQSSTNTIFSCGPVILADTLTYVELTATLSGTTNINCAVELFINGVSQGSANANINRNIVDLASDSATFNQLTLNSGVVNNGQCIFTDLYLNNGQGSVNTGALGPVLIDAYPLPNADGSETSWIPDTGTVHYSRVNENPADEDGSYVKSATVGNKDSYGWQDLTSLIDTINAVQLTYLARVDAEGARSYRGTIGNHGLEAQTQTYGLSWDYIYNHQSFDLDPNGNIAWTPANFNTKEFGLELIS